ncbi:MAG TPA: hypothetical protein VHA05_03225 [Candidatus Saccharimonadales bacterium]|nr:hypothetical protein [Candidatus Saccharimonadales bacterium]
MLYDKIVTTTNVYLGPAAERFIARQVQSHLSKPPEEITKDDLKNLLDWIRVAVSLLTDDGELIEEYINELNKLCADGESGTKKQRKLL